MQPDEPPAAARCCLSVQVVSSALVELLNKYERTPELVAEVLRYSVAHWDDARLVS